MEMTENNGYNGRMLEANLKEGTFRSVELDKKWLDLYAGGAGYATRLLYELIDADTFPLSAENPVIVMVGPLTGFSAISPKTSIVTKSPLTGFLGKSMASGSFGMALKKAGFDGILIKGKASEPVFISIINGTPGLHKAAHVWGKGTFETCKIVREQMGNQKVRIAAIGPAGESLVKIAAVITDERRAFGRTGIGAVIGSKLLKAIVVRGDKKVNVADEKHLLELNKKHLLIAPQTSRGGGLKAYGTGGGVLTGALSGNLPIKNWTQGTWPDAEKITSQTFMPQYKYGSGEKACGEEVLCSIHCERSISVKASKYGESMGKGPEYETLGALGSMILVNNILAIVKANDMCDDLGLDTISTGTTIAWAMEAYEKGLLSDSDIGFPLKWGDEGAMIKLIDMIAFKRGVGKLLSEGVKEASRKIGKESRKFAMHSKGLEIPMHNPILYQTMGVLYSTSNIGGSHLQGMGILVERGMLLPEYGINLVPKDMQSKIETSVIQQNLCTFIDSAGLCKFGVFGVIDFNHIAEVYNAVTGKHENKDTILKIGERIWYLERELNLKLGLKPEDDALPERFLKEPVKDGPMKDQIFPIEIYLPEFYKTREINPSTGKPSQEKIRELSLDI